MKLIQHPGDEDGFFKEAFWDKSIQVDVNSSDGEKRCVASIAYFLQEKDKAGEFYKEILLLLMFYGISWGLMVGS